MKNRYLSLLVCIIFISGYIYFEKNQKYSESTKTETLDQEEDNKKFQLAEVSRDLGIDISHEFYDVHPKLMHINKWLNSNGAGVSASDYNNDGYIDLFFCNGRIGSQNTLFKNLGNGKFKNVTKEVGLDFVNSKDTVCFRPTFLDYNGDGLRDLFISTHYCPLLFKQLPNGTFEDVSSSSQVNRYCTGSFASNILDYNNDGYLDIIMAGYFSRVNIFDPHSTKILQNSSSNATNGGESFLLKNNGDGTFSDQTKAAGLKFKSWVLAIGVYDLNYDGHADIWVASDYGPNKLFVNNGDGTFKDRSPEISHDYARSGMGIAIADIQHNRKPLIYISQNYNPFDRISGNQIYEYNDKGPIVDVAKRRKLNKCGWSWGNQFVDLNNDSNEDLVVVNGFISGNKDKEYWYHLSELNSAGPDIISDAKNWKPFDDYSIGGHQKNCIFLNTGQKLVDISESSIFSRDIRDSRAVAKLDYDNNGSLDLVVTNQGRKPFFFKNQIKGEPQWIGFSLVGRKNNRFAIGAKVEIKTDSGQTIIKQLYDANGFLSQSDGRLHFGLGHTKITDIVIIWPWGETQEIKNFKYNTYNEYSYNVVYK